MDCVPPLVNGHSNGNGCSANAVFTKIVRIVTDKIVIITLFTLLTKKIYYYMLCIRG